MSFLKPLIKTILVSSILFFALVYLGMKYHWIGFNQGDDKKLKLKLPANPIALGIESPENSVSNTNEEKIFQPQIIQTVRSSSLVINMTKEQVTEGCTQLLRKKMADIDLLELLIGNCVISNYRDYIIEKPLEEGTMRSTKSRQAQIRKNNVLNICQQNLSTEKFSNEIERQLLLGICVSGKLK